MRKMIMRLFDDDDDDDDASKQASKQARQCSMAWWTHLIQNANNQRRLIVTVTIDIVICSPVVDASTVENVLLS